MTATQARTKPDPDATRRAWLDSLEQEVRRTGALPRNFTFTATIGIDSGDYYHGNPFLVQGGTTLADLADRMAKAADEGIANRMKASWEGDGFNYDADALVFESNVLEGFVLQIGGRYENHCAANDDTWITVRMAEFLP